MTPLPREVAEALRHVVGEDRWAPTGIVVVVLILLLLIFFYDGTRYAESGPDAPFAAAAIADPPDMRGSDSPRIIVPLRELPL